MDIYIYIFILFLTIFISYNFYVKLQKLKKQNYVLVQYIKAIEENNIVSKTDVEGNIIYVNDKFCETTLYSRDEILGQSYKLLMQHDCIELLEDLYLIKKSKKPWQGIIKSKKKDGKHYFVNMAVSPIVNEKNEVIEYIAIRHEVTDLINKTQELENNLRKNFLTKEGNRFKLIEDINNSEKPFLALLNINQFGEINDLYGHKFGDEILKVLTKIIKMFLKEDYFIYRLYSDEFAILANNKSKNEFIKEIKFICDEISSYPIKIRNKEIYIQLSQGISFEKKEDLINTADMIKRYAKKNKNIYIYDKNFEIEKIYEKNILWTSKVKKALENDRIVPYYQAIYNVKTNKIEKYEALVRLIDDDGIAVSPYYFLDIAKKSKQYLKLTKVVVKKSFDYFKDKDFEFSINITIEDIKNENISSYILDMLKEYNIASKVVFEIVESEGIDDFTQVNNFIDDVRKLGCKIAIDDFGSGYSNFEYLIKLNADYIKIDGSLIKDILINKSSQEIVVTIIDFAKRQGFKTIAEFVSDEEIFKKVKDLGIDYVQGYYIDEPRFDIYTFQ